MAKKEKAIEELEEKATEGFARLVTMGTNLASIHLPGNTKALKPIDGKIEVKPEQVLAARRLGCWVIPKDNEG